MSKPRIVLAEDHAILRESLSGLLEPEFDVVAVVEDGREVVAESERLRPDVVVLDVGLPVLNGMEAASQVRTLLPQTKVVFLTQQSGKEYVQAAFRMGACGYLLKSSAALELVKGLREVVAGRRFLSAQLQERFGDPSARQDGTGELFGVKLTERQKEVLRLIAGGKSVQEIASTLNTSVKTVEFHRGAILNELGLRNVEELKRYGAEQGIVAGDSEPLSSGGTASGIKE